MADRKLTPEESRKLKKQELATAIATAPLEPIDEEENPYEAAERAVLIAAGSVLVVAVVATVAAVAIKFKNRHYDSL